MRYQVITGADGRIVASSADSLLSGAIAADMPEGFGCETQSDWRNVNGVWVYDPQTDEEKLAQPTPAEINAAQIDYIAMMTGVEL